MNERVIRGEEPPKPFPSFLEDLRQQDDVSWSWLLDHFREKVVPYIRKKDGNLPKDAIVSEGYFIEEIFANSLIKFYELFDNGSFDNLGQLRGLMFRITELKLLEAYKQVKRDKALYFSDAAASDTNKYIEDDPLTHQEAEQLTVIRQIKSALKELPDTDQEVLLRYAQGEQLKIIAQQLNIKEVNCRKKKQRALDKLRKLLKPLIYNTGS